MKQIKPYIKKLVSKKTIEEAYPFLTIASRWNNNMYYCTATLNQDCKFGKQGKVIATSYLNYDDLKNAIEEFITNQEEQEHGL